MITRTVPAIGAFDAFRSAARDLALRGIPDTDVQWTRPTLQGGLFAEPIAASTQHRCVKLLVPGAFVELARTATLHSAEHVHALLYRLLLRLQKEPRLLDNAADTDVKRLEDAAKAVRRDAHKMKAFVRFREVGDTSNKRRGFLAWFEPEHFILDKTAPFFARRFADMDWAILTPKGSARYIDGVLHLDGAPAQKPMGSDAMDELWKTYYASIFNPARVKVKAMTSEMPRKYWHNLPEAALIPELIATAQKRADAMRQAAPSLPPAHLAKFKSPAIVHAKPAERYASLEDLATAAQHCRLCPLHGSATQAVTGEGPADASIMFIGEQPGDQEDLHGKPFLGPAGQVVDEGLRAAGLVRRDIYVTNAVKHFKYRQRGKLRLHQRPTADEVETCRWWLTREIDFLRPRLVVAMGQTAFAALGGTPRDFAARRGTLLETDDGYALLVTYHPAAILRNPTQALTLKAEFSAHLAMVKAWQTRVGTVGI